MGREELITTAECPYSVTVGEAAKWTVGESTRLQRQRWAPHPLAEERRQGVHQQRAPEKAA
jgi:hypothetical protein